MKIVVGTDLSDGAALALQWAAAEAETHDATVEAVLAWDVLDEDLTEWTDATEPTEGVKLAGEALDAWVARTLETPQSTTTQVVSGAPVQALLAVGDKADLLVVGARGSGGFKGLLLGSTSERVVQYATRPVAVVSAAAPTRGGRVVVGVDGSTNSRDALRWAAEEARARDAELQIVHAWKPSIPSASPFVVPDYTTLEAAAKDVLEGATSDRSLGDLRVRPRFVHSSPGHALVELSQGAGLVVVGSRGHGRVAAALLGSVSRQLLHHACCPVVVI